MSRRGALLLLGLVSSVVWAAEPSVQGQNPVLVSPHFSSLFVTFAGFGKAVPKSEQRIAESGEPNHQIAMTAEPGDSIWLKLQNNTRWGIVIPTDSMYMAGLRNGMQISVWFVVLDRKGELIPSPYDTGAMSLLPSDCTVFFAVPREALKAGKSIRFNFRYEWEPESQSFSGGYVHHELLITSELLPPAARE